MPTGSIELLTITVLWPLLSVAVAMYAQRRGQNPLLWFVIALFITPLLAFVGLLLFARHAPSPKT